MLENTLSDLKALANILTEHGLTAIELANEKTRYKLEKNYKVNLNNECISDVGIKNEEELKLVKSPMLGIFYTATSPEDQPFVRIGSKIKKGDTLCIIEVMKAFTEILAEEDGEIVEICPKNGETVEYLQTLFKYKK